MLKTLFFFKKEFIHLFICLQWILGAVHGIQFPNQQSKPGILRWKHGVLTTGPHLLYPFLSQWTFRLYPCLGYCKRATMNTGVHVFFHTMFSLDIRPGGAAGPYGSFYLFVFKGISILFSKVAEPIYIPTNSTEGFPSLHTLSAIYSLLTILLVSIRSPVKNSSHSLCWQFLFFLIMQNRGFIHFVYLKRISFWFCQFISFFFLLCVCG